MNDRQIALLTSALWCIASGVAPDGTIISLIYAALGGLFFMGAFTLPLRKP